MKIPKSCWLIFLLRFRLGVSIVNCPTRWSLNCHLQLRFFFLAKAFPQSRSSSAWAPWSSCASSSASSCASSSIGRRCAAIVGLSLRLGRSSSSVGGCPPRRQHLHVCEAPRIAVNKLFESWIFEALNLWISMCVKHQGEFLWNTTHTIEKEKSVFASVILWLCAKDKRILAASRSGKNLFSSSW